MIADQYTNQKLTRIKSSISSEGQKKSWNGQCDKVQSRCLVVKTKKRKRENMQKLRENHEIKKKLGL